MSLLCLHLDVNQGISWDNSGNFSEEDSAVSTPSKKRGKGKEKAHRFRWAFSSLVAGVGFEPTTSCL
jgi:hypothetical protein